MRSNKLGRTGLFVSELCLGTMTFGGGDGVWGKMGGLNQEDAERLMGRTIDAGINFIDTADVYSNGLSVPRGWTNWTTTLQRPTWS